MNLKKVPTKELVEELKLREGVEITIVEPYKEKSLKIDGPAIVLKVID